MAENTKPEQAKPEQAKPAYALKTICINGRWFAPGDEVKTDDPQRIDRGLQTSLMTHNKSEADAARRKAIEQQQAKSKAKQLPTEAAPTSPSSEATSRPALPGKSTAN